MSNFVKRWSDANFVSFLLYYYCNNAVVKRLRPYFEFKSRYVPWLSEWTAFQWDSEVCKEVVKVELDLNSWASCESSVDSAVAGKQLLKIPNQYEFHYLEQKNVY